jgi:hypothetical protein
MSTSIKIAKSTSATADTTPVIVDITGVKTPTYILSIYVTGSYPVSVVADVTETNHTAFQAASKDRFTVPVPLRVADGAPYLYADAASTVVVSCHPVTGEGA